MVEPIIRVAKENIHEFKKHNVEFKAMKQKVDETYI